MSVKMAHCFFLCLRHLELAIGAATYLPCIWRLPIYFVTLFVLYLSPYHELSYVTTLVQNF
jgi:hypothetical protein